MRRLIACLAAVAPLTCAQTGPLRFEVASIRPVDPKAPISSGLRIYPGGRLVVSGTLKDLVMIAFHLSYHQISGGDPWTEQEKL